MSLQNQVNFGHVLKTLVPTLVLLLGWGISVEIMRKDVTENIKDIREIKGDAKEIKKQASDNHQEVMQSLHNIQLELKDKKDRE